MTNPSNINTYPDCEKCGHCCQLNILAITDEDLEIMHRYVRENDIKPINQHSERCCFQKPDSTCLIWDARPQVCRLHNCHVPRIEILRQHPDIVVPDDIPLRNLHEEFCLSYPTQSTDTK